MRVVRTKRDFVVHWLHRGWWYGVSFALLTGIWATLVIVPAFLIGCLVGLLSGPVPSLSAVKTDRWVLLSTAISLVLCGIFIHLDSRKWHISEKLRQLRENGRFRGT